MSLDITYECSTAPLLNLEVSSYVRVAWQITDMKAALKRLFRKHEADAPSSSSIQSPSPSSTPARSPMSKTSQSTLTAIPERAAHVCCALTRTSEPGCLPQNGAIMVDATSPVSHALPNGDLNKIRQIWRAQGPLVPEAHPPVSEQPEHLSESRSGQQLRIGRRSLDVSLEELPSVDHLAESGWTRALTGNIKQIAQVQGALGYLGPGAPHSPNTSLSGARISACSNRGQRRSSAMSFFCHDPNPMPTVSSPMTSHRGLTSTSLEDSLPRDDEEIAVLPSVLPPALLQEAARNGVNLQVCLDTDVVLTSDTPLGRGTSGEVFQATYHGQPCAVKILPPDTLHGSSTAELHTLVQEVVVLASLRHTSIVTFLGASLQPPHVFLLAELCQTSLDAVLHGRVAATPAGCCRPLSTRGMLTVALDVAKGLQYLHERTPAIVHRDLKPANILIDANGTAKISDFGLARVKTGAAICTKTPEVGSLGYMAPECFTDEDGLLSDKCDTWSLGVVLWEMVARKRPWPGLNMAEYYREVVIRKSRLQIPQDDSVCPLALRRLISSCWCDVPEERPSCAHIVSELTRMLKYSPQD